MRESLNITYHFIDTITGNEYKKFRGKIKLLGGTFIYQNLQQDNAFCVVKCMDLVSRIKFEREFTLTPEYQLTKEYELEQKEQIFFKAINEKCFHWSENYLETLFFRSDSFVPEKKDDSWDLLVILLNEGLIRVRAEDYPDVPIPPQHIKERDEYYQYFNKQEDTMNYYLSLCGWNWLKGKGEKTPIYTYSDATLFSPSLKIFIKIGEGDPYQIIYQILAEDSNTYVHIPYRQLNKLYILEATELFYSWLEYHRNGSHFEYPSEEQKLLSSYIYHLRGSTKLRKEITYFITKQKKIQESGEKSYRDMLGEYDENTLFDLEDAVKIIQRIKEGEISVELLEILINKGVLKAQRIRDIWVISKQSLLDYLHAIEIQEEQEIEIEPVVEQVQKVTEIVPPLKGTNKLNSFKDTEEFTLNEVGEFIKNDATYGIGIAPTIRMIKHLIRTGELKAYQKNSNWKVRKQDLVKYLQSQKSEFATYTKKKEISKEATKVISKQTGWTEEKDKLLVKNVLDGLIKGKKFDEIFRDGINEIGMNAKQCKNRWYTKWSYKCRHDVTKIKEEISRRENLKLEKEKEPKEIIEQNKISEYKKHFYQKDNPNNWTENKVKILISSILEGTREGKTIKVITEEVSQKIGISASACHSYWNSKAPKQYKEEFKQIKLDQENWSNEDIQLLDHLISVEYAHLTPFDILPFASQRLKKHIDVVRKKLFSLQREKRLRDE